MAEDIEPRRVEEFDTIAPSGRWHKIRKIGRAQRVEHWTTMAVVAFISAILWGVYLLWMWRTVFG